MTPVLLPLVSNVTMLLGTLTAEEINRLLGVKSEITKLKRMFEHMLDIIKEAEQMNGQDAKTKHWLKQLRDDVYKTDDIIDLCRIEAERRKALESAEKLERHIKSLLNCYKVVTVNCHVSRSIRKLNLDMEKISRESSMLHRRYSAMRDQLIGSFYDTIPYHEPNVVGKCVADDTKSLVRLLKTEHERSSLLFAIVGMVGIGKTTLARKIYHNEEMSKAFQPRLWVCVNKDTDYLTVLKRLVLSAGGNPVESDTREKLENMLNKCIKRKKFLLVLDDVWTETIWENMLENHLQSGARGSRVLMTSRHKHVAKRMGAFHLHHVKRLTREDGWVLLHTRSLLDDSDETRAMQDFGKEIVDKCDGLPMVIRSVAGVLRCREQTRDEWKNVYNSIFKVLPDEVQGIIRLSYVDLPPNLKKCFLYCSLFPADFMIEKRYITQQWVSEGFVEVTHHSALEDVAEDYYRELMARSLLMPARGLDGEDGAKMPNIFRLLAQELSHDENFSGDLRCINDPFEPRRLSLAYELVRTVPRDIRKLKSLRTLLFFENQHLEMTDSSFPRTFRRLTLLRVLDLHRTKIEEVPGALGNLVHLRYLNLSGTGVKKLPDSVRNLRLLQFLILNSCEDLSTLPKGIEQLRNLRSLEISRRNTLEDLRMSFARLDELNCLRGFLVKNSAGNQQSACGWPLQELSSLSKLTSLQILRLERALSKEEARESMLSNKMNLRELELCCGNERPGEEGKIKEIFEELCPVTRLLFLKLEKYYGHGYPSWISGSKLPNLQRLDLRNCYCCRRLPPLGELAQLRDLAIKGSRELRTIGPELRGNQNGQKAAFPKLERLQFSRLENLESWSGLEDGDLPCLQKFMLKSCWKLSSLPRVIERRATSGSAIIVDVECPELRTSSVGSGTTSPRDSRMNRETRCIMM